jgi:hypothetical protein
VVCDETKKDDATKQLYYLAKTNIHSFTNNQNILPILGTSCMIMMTPHFLDDESGKNFRFIFE